MNDTRAFSFGATLDMVEDVRQVVSEVYESSTEHYERRLAISVGLLCDVVKDVLEEMREHFACHDCNIPEHKHYGHEYQGTSIAKTGGVVDEKVG